MFFSLLVLAEVTSHAPEATGPTKIMHDFGISLPGIAAQILNVGIVVFILWKFAFKPVLATLDERQQKIASGLQYAEDMKAKLEAAQQESAASAKRAALAMFPDKELAYDLLYKPRIQRLMRERFRLQ